MDSVPPRPVCAKEAIDLLNCAVESPFDGDKCLRLLDALRSCVLEKLVAGVSILLLIVIHGSEDLKFGLHRAENINKVRRFLVVEQSNAAENPKSKEKL